MNKINVSEALKAAESRHKRQQKKWNGDRAFKPAIKYYKTLNKFKASNVVFDPSTMIATSYKWWEFVKVIGGKVVFNNYSYSSSTSKHQSKMHNLLNQLGIKIDVTIESPRGLQDLQGAARNYYYRIGILREEIAKPRSRKASNARRAEEITRLESKIKEVETLIRCEEIDNRFAARGLGVYAQAAA